MLRDLVAGLAQIAQRLDHRQSRAHRGLVQIVRAAGAPRGLEAFVVGQLAAVGLLVRRDDVDAGGEPVAVVARDLRIGAAVDDHRVRQVIDVHVLDEARQIRGLRLPLELLAPAAQLDLVVGKQHLL